MKGKDWLLLACLLGIGISALKGCAVERQLAVWQAKAKLVSDSNQIALRLTDSTKTANQRISQSLETEKTHRQGLESEAERLRAALRNRGVVPRDTIYSPIIDTLRLLVSTDSLRVVSLEKSLAEADSGRLLALSALLVTQRQLVVSDSLLKHYPKPVKPWLSLRLDARTDFGGATAIAALQHNGWYAGVGVDEGLRKRFVMGWTKTVHVF